jgi:hypothetical protein
MRRTGDGGWINEAGPLPIAEVDGRPYELAFDREVRLWIVQEGVHR